MVREEFIKPIRVQERNLVVIETEIDEDSQKDSHESHPLTFGSSILVYEETVAIIEPKEDEEHKPCETDEAILIEDIEFEDMSVVNHQPRPGCIDRVRPE